MPYLGIEIGGTKLQLGLGAGDGKLAALWRGKIDRAQGSAGIRQQIASAVPLLLAQAKTEREQIAAVGVGFGGPVDIARQTVIRSFQIEGWDNFPIGAWITDLLGIPATVANDADVAGLAEALHGAGQGHSPIFYITIGSGIGGALITDQKIYPGAGRGAAEIGHLMITQLHDGQSKTDIMENWSSGWGIERQVRAALGRADAPPSMLTGMTHNNLDFITTQHIAKAAAAGDPIAAVALNSAIEALAQAIRHVITLLCPKRIVIGGGVSLIGEPLFFTPLRAKVAKDVFKPYTGLTEILPAALGEEVVIHGAIALAKDAHKFKQRS